MPDELRQRMLQIIVDFFKDKPPGTSFSDATLNAYRQQLRDACKVTP